MDGSVVFVALLVGLPFLLLVVVLFWDPLRRFALRTRSREVDATTRDKAPASSESVARKLCAADLVVTGGVGAMLGIGAALGLHVGRDHGWARYVGGILGGVSVLFGVPICTQMRRTNRKLGIWSRRQTLVLLLLQWSAALVVGLFVTLLYSWG